MITTFAALLLVAGVPSYAAQPQTDPAIRETMTAEQREAEVRDRVEYRRLTREIIRIDREYEQRLADAVEEARASGTGEAGLEQQAEMLSLRDRRDRLLNRLMLLSLRHGWEVPDFEAEAAKRGEQLDGKEAVFARSSAMVRQEFAREAAAMAQSLDLPIVTLTVER